MQVQTMSFAGQHTEEQISYTTKDISRGQIYNVVVTQLIYTGRRRREPANI